MPLTRLAADAFGVVTIALVSLSIVLGLLCISYSVYFHSRIRKEGLLKLGYFDGPWIARIAFVLVAIWWGIGEILRLSLLRGTGRLFTSLVWQKEACKFYIISNSGFAEPYLFILLALLLHASLQKRKLDALGRWWNAKTIGLASLFCLPVFTLQLGLVFLGPKFLNKERSPSVKLATYFWGVSFLREGRSTCTYPLFNTTLLGLCYVVLVGYVSYFGAQLAFLAINKRLRRRVRILIFSTVLFVSCRVILLGLTVLLSPGSLAFEAFVFLAFLLLLLGALVGVCILVYYPVADSLALRRVVHLDIEELPFDDYYCDDATPMANRRQPETGRNSDAPTKQCSIIISDYMAKEETTATDVSEDVGLSWPAALPSASSPASSLPPGRPVAPFPLVPEN